MNIDIYCDGCGSLLTHRTDIKRGETLMRVVPCSDCIDDARTEGRDMGNDEGYNEGYQEGHKEANDEIFESHKLQPAQD